MKKIVFVAAFTLASVASSTAFATAACSGTAAGSSVNIATSSLFIKRSFAAKCSANVLSAYSENNTDIGVVAGSQKGKSYFGGGSNGGGVKFIANCAASTGCTTNQDITDANAQTARDSTS